MYRLLSIALLSLAFLLPTAAVAGDYKAGKHYKVLSDPVATQHPERVEVVEVFWYGCKHCYRFSAQVTRWLESLPEDIEFVRMPAIWHPRMALHARAYFAAQGMSMLDRMHPKLFDAMHARGLKLQDEREITEVFETAGVDRQQFSGEFNSFGVRGQVLRAEQRCRAYQVIGTPCMVVNGKYLVTVESAGGRAEILEVVNFLVAQERQAL